MNQRLAGELHIYNELQPYLDAAVDDINTRLGSKFPVFSELPDTATEYDFFPDKYIRTVVVPGAALKYFIADEEGMGTAFRYEEEYQQALFYMERDYLLLIPEEYLASSVQGTYKFEEGHPLYDRGLEVDVFDFTL